MGIFSKVLWASVATVAITGCIKSPRIANKERETSKVTSVSMRVPTQIGGKDISGKITGYSLQVKKTDGSCDFTDIDRVEKIAAGDVKIDAKLKQECDYSIVLSFGQISSDQTKIDKVYLTSNAFEGKPARAAKVTKDELRGKSQVTITACVSVTTLGAAELGVNAADCPSITDNSIGNNPNPVTPQSTLQSTSLKLTKKMTGTAEGYEVFFSGEVTSLGSANKYCAIAIDAYYEAPTPKLVLFDESFFEIKPGEKLTLNKNLTVDVGSLSGPLEFRDLLVLEQCFDQKPEATVKAADLFAKCYADKKCPVVK